MPPVDSDSWTPQGNPQALLNDARDDVSAGRYSAALAKFRWLHEHAASIDSAWRPVHCTMLLSCWCDLAKKYPPAHDALKQCRDNAVNNFSNKRDGPNHFADFWFINKYLGEDALTRTVFLSLDTNNSELAKCVFRLVLPILIEGKDYQLIEKYLDPDEFYCDALLRFLMRPRHRAAQKEWEEGMFTHACATLIAILVINGHEARAKMFSVKAKIEWGDPRFHDAIDSALGGELPDSRSRD